MKHKIYIGQNLNEYEEVERKVEIDGEEFEIQEKREDIIELSPHEITSVATLYPVRKESNGVKLRNELRIEIEGKIVTNKNNSSEISGLYEEKGKGEVIQIKNYVLDINSHRLNDMMYEVRLGRAQLHGGVLDRKEKTFKINDSEHFGTNAVKLKKWTLDNLIETDYREMILAVIYSENEIRATRYRNLYVIDYKEFLSGKEGVPSFKIVLGQKYEEKKKEKQKEEEIRKVPIARKEEEIILFFDVNESHVDFLLGKRESLSIQKIELSSFKNEGLDKFMKSKETLYIGYKENLKFLFEGEKRELTERELGGVQSVNVNKKYQPKEIANTDMTTLLANAMDEFFSQVIVENVINVIKLNIEKKQKKEIVEEDYCIYKFEHERGKYLLIGMSKEIHYGRNKYQKDIIPFHKKDLEKVKTNKEIEELFENKFPQMVLDSTVYYFREKDMFFKKLNILKSLYHGTENEKYINISSEKSTSGLYEIVFNSKGEQVLDDENLGTFNFYGPDSKNAHFLYDMLPYWLWGNSDNDENSLVNRIAAKDNIKRMVAKRIIENNIRTIVVIMKGYILFEKWNRLFKI